MPINLRLLQTQRMYSSRVILGASQASSPSTSGTSSSPPQLDITSRRQRRENHKPRINVPEGEETYYVLTLQTDPAHHKAMCALRERYYPPALLRVSAHISLFRALPGSVLPSLRTDITTAATDSAVRDPCGRPTNPDGSRRREDLSDWAGASGAYGAGAPGEVARRAKPSGSRGVSRPLYADEQSGRRGQGIALYRRATPRV
ncbi:hypothetical protein F4677DRAFT_427665 [Hypoxylon crocopeplum]|nr:hypothetical protein F4677DRAFT_427665 [Hypoxylon crocopeplum]